MPSRSNLTAAMLHGSGSDAAFIKSAFAAPFARAGLRLLAPDDRSGDLAAMVRSLQGLTARNDDLAIAGGVSVGAHAAALWAAHKAPATLRGLVLVMPAWTGHPGPAAALTAATARGIDKHGLTAELTRLRHEVAPADDWVLAELQRAWPHQADTLAASMLRTARSRGPYPSELARISVPTALIALRDDPLHPLEVADEWANLIPRAVVVSVNRYAPTTDRSVFGRAALEGLRRVGALS